MNNLIVKFFVDGTSKKELATLIKSLDFENKNSFEIDIVKNSDFNESESKKFPDGFLSFPFLIEYYFDGEVETADISNATVILERFWKNNISAIASCDFEDKLPENGGYKSKISHGAILKHGQNTMTTFDIVKQAIDEWDPYGLLSSGASSDEFDRESRKISNKISKGSSVKDIAITISKVFSSSFEPFSVDECMRVAEKIKKAMRKK
jgi:hypothetical protein